MGPTATPNHGRTALWAPVGAALWVHLCPNPVEQLGQPKLNCSVLTTRAVLGGLETLTWMCPTVVAAGSLVVPGVTMYINIYISVYISAAVHSGFPLCCLGACLLAGVNQTPPHPHVTAVVQRSVRSAAPQSPAQNGH